MVAAPWTKKNAPTKSNTKKESRNQKEYNHSCMLL